MKKYFLYIISIFSLFLTSCVSEKLEQIEVEVQFFNEIKVNKEENIEKEGLLPELYEATKPMNIDKVDYVFFPLSVKRVDSGKKIEIDYLNKKGRNYKKINAIIRAHREYFKDGKDTEVDDRLTAPLQQKTDFDAYVNQNKSKENYFFIDFNGNLKIDGEEVPSSAEQLSKKIEKYILSKVDKKNKKNELDKIVIVITPNYYFGGEPIVVIPSVGNDTIDTTTSSQPQILSFSAQPKSIQKGNATTLSWQTQNVASVSISNVGTFAAKGSTTVSPQKTTTYILTATDVNGISISQNVSVSVQGKQDGGGGDTPCPQESASDVQDWLQKLTDKTIDDCRKTTLVGSYGQFFASGAVIVLVDNVGTQLQTFSSVSGYVSRIRGKHKKIRIDYDNSEMSGGKYTKLAVREP